MYIVGLLRFSRMMEQLQSIDSDIDIRIVQKDSAEAAMLKMYQLLQKAKYDLYQRTELRVILDMGPEANLQILESMVTLLWNNSFLRLGVSSNPQYQDWKYKH